MAAVRSISFTCGTLSVESTLIAIRRQDRRRTDLLRGRHRRFLSTQSRSSTI